MSEYAYACEQCGDAVILTVTQYEDMAYERERRNGRPLSIGPRILCPPCEETWNAAPALLVKSRSRGERRPMSMPPNETRLELTPAERRDYGVTLTVREQDTGATDVIVTNGGVIEATREACRQIDQREGTWRVVTVSTPATIFADLQGARDLEMMTPEQKILAMAGRRDLLEERPWRVMTSA